MYRPHSLEEHPDYSLAFVELDDQGELWSPAQLERALAHLERLNQNPEGVALVLFVHGWNTDASPHEEREGEGTLYLYRAMLSRLTEGMRSEFPQVDIPVMGIYLSWRGRVSSVPLLREASFYNRRGAAERIAGAPATEAIYRILMTLRRNPASRSVLFGHSFGSMILERALSQAVVSALLGADGRRLIFPADLVVLLNPAGSASQTKQLVDILARNRLKTYRFDQDGNRFERPLLVSFTSESDKATRRFFPIGMRVKAMTKKFRQYGQDYCSPISDQKTLYTHTAGHLPALHSHEVTIESKGGGRTTAPPAEPAPDRLIPGYLGYEESYDPLTQNIVFSFDGEQDRYSISRKPRSLNDTPYWIARVPAELIPSHSAILTENTFRLVEAVLVLSGTYDADVATVVVREDGVRPVAVVPRPDGTAFFLDRSRGLYAVRSDSTRAVFLTCLSETIDPSDAIGLFVAGHLAYAVVSTPSGGSPGRGCDTTLYEFEIEDTGYRQVARLRLADDSCYEAATIDLAAKRVLLSIAAEDGSEIRAATLASERPEPHRLLRLPDHEPPSSLYFDGPGTRLFAAAARSGILLEIDMRADPPGVRQIGHEELGSPTALALSKLDGRLFVTDGEQHRIWAYDCGGDHCHSPEIFLQSDTLRAPTTLAVGLDGTLWLGNLRDQSLTAIAPDGTVESTIVTLGGSF